MACSRCPRTPATEALRCEHVSEWTAVTNNREANLSITKRTTKPFLNIKYKYTAACTKTSRFHHALRDCKYSEFAQISHKCEPIVAGIPAIRHRLKDAFSERGFIFVEYFIRRTLSDSKGYSLRPEDVI